VIHRAAGRHDQVLCGALATGQCPSGTLKAGAVHQAVK
jgi:hypothetical protein